MYVCLQFVDLVDFNYIFIKKKISMLEHSEHKAKLKHTTEVESIIIFNDRSEEYAS